MKRKGFTLIELLAVIVILAVIAIIAIPLITNVIEKAKEGAARDGGYNYLKAVETGIAANKLDNSKPDINDGIYSVSELKDTYKVEVKGKAPTDGEITIENGKITSCSLTIDDYNFVCNGNELVLGESLIPEHRMMNSFTNGDDASYKLAYTYLLLDNMIPTDYTTWRDLTLSNTNPFDSNLAIEKVLTVKNNTVPANAIGSKDISANQDGSVMVWYLDDDNDSKYEVYIGQNGGVIAPINCSNLFAGLRFYGAPGLEIDLSNMDTSYTEKMKGMFLNVTNLTSLNISSFNTSKVTDMSGMFLYCKNLTSLNVSHFNTSRVTNMSQMFVYCEKLVSLDVSHFDTSKVTQINGMFDGCKNLKTLNVSHFDTSKVTNMEFMFYNCKGLTSLDLSNFNTSEVTNMRWMFGDCKGLTTLDLSSFDTSKVTDMQYMFSGSSNLNTIYVGPNWVINSGTNTSNMFSSCGTSTTTLKS